MGAKVIIFGKILNSSFLKGLRHSAMEHHDCIRPLFPLLQERKDLLNQWYLLVFKGLAVVLVLVSLGYLLGRSYLAVSSQNLSIAKIGLTTGLKRQKKISYAKGQFKKQ